MRAQILSIGSELILGHLTDTNATYLAQQLAGLGIELTLVTQVGDDLPRLTETLRRATAESDLVVCTGGVGPTADDLTREAIASLAGEVPIVQPNLLAEIEAFFHARGLQMPERNKKQAWLIPSAEALPNPVGTAPGWFARIGNSVVVAMPGVPREMFRMWREQAVPRVLAQGSARSIRSTTVRTIGIGESAAEQVLHDLVALENPVVATYAKDDGVHVRITVTASTDEDATRERDAAVAEVITRLERYVYGLDETTLPRALADLLDRANARVSVHDHGGGGRFAALLAGDPVAADLVRSGVMAPSGGESAEELARAAAIQADGVVGVGIRVAARPAGDGVYEGTIDVAVAGVVTASESMPMRSGWEDIQRRSALQAADVLRRALRSITR